MGFDCHNKCVFFFFLSPKIAALISSIIMLGVCSGTYILNIMIHEEIGNFLLRVARIFGVAVLVSLVVFIIGLIIVMIKQFLTFFAVYLFFTLSCFCCNFSTLIFANCYRESYNLYTIYVDYYYEYNPDTELEEDQIKEIMRKTFYIKTVLHVVALCVMYYYYRVTSIYIEEKTGEDILFAKDFISGSKKSSLNYYESTSSNNARKIGI